MTFPTTASKDGPQHSPDGLGFKTKPQGVVRVNKKALAIGGGMLLIVLSAISIGVLTRQPSTGIHSETTADIDSRLVPALEAGRQITGAIPDGNFPERSNLNNSTPFALSESATPNLGAPQQRPLPAGMPPAAPINLAGGQQQVPVVQTERETQLKQAREAGTAAQSSSTGSGGPMQLVNAVMPGGAGVGAGGLGSALQSLAARQQATNLAQAPRDLEDDPNKQQHKEQFLRNMEETPDRNFVNSTRRASVSRYEIKAGWIIPAAMEHGINSDLPGKLSARVTQNVWDTATGRHLMVPQGSMLIGTYDSQVAFGQDGLLVVWRRIVFPDGSSIDLEGMGGVDESGYSGFRDQVNNHYGRIFGYGLLTSLFSAAFQISQQNNQTPVGTVPTPAQTIGTSVAQQMTQLGIEIARKNLQVQPTIKIRPGYKFNVRVEKDLLFSRPYVFGNAQ